MLTARLRRRLQDFSFFVARRLPRRLVYHCAIRVWAHATCGRWGHENATELTCDEALRRWELPR